jgi:dihydroorotate dehydrogenase (NAD+) catalytic subunit
MNSAGAGGKETQAVGCDVKLGGLGLRNPVMTASGTFGYGEEMASFVDLSRLGAVIGKTITREPRAGNAPPRTCEVASGMLNAIGLQNVGIEKFIASKLPRFREMRAEGIGTPFVVNIAGDSAGDFALLAARLGEQADIVAALELNISCPNVAHGLDFASDPTATAQLVREVRKATELPILVKLSPNVSDIALIARAAEDGGADALSLVNTFVGMSIDVRTRRPRLSNVTGGMSGPAIKPLALRAVHKCAQAVRVPLVGIGGIVSALDAVEFFIAGASAVQIGTASFVQPDATTRILDGIQKYLQENKFSHLNELVGCLKID